MPDASISLGLNAASMYSDLKTAEQRFNAGMDNMGKSVNRLTGAHDNLFRSNHRVATQIHTVTRDLLSGASAGDVFGASLEGIGRSLNLSLGALAGLAVGAVVVQKIYQVTEQYRKLREELELVHKAANKSGDYQTLSQLEAAASKAEDAIKKLQERITDRAGNNSSGGVVQRLKDYLTHGYGFVAAGPQDKALQDKAYGDLDKNAAERANKLQQKTDIRKRTAAGAPEYEGKAQELRILSDEAQGAAKSLDEMAAIANKLTQDFEELSKSVSDKHMERAGMTLGEHAALPDVVNNSVSYERWKASQDAKAAQRADAAGEAARKNFDPEGAHANFNVAGAIKESIPDLKPSERMGSDFKGALQVTEQTLREIANKVSFKRGG